MAEKPTAEQVETLRDLFFKRCEKENPPCGSFDQRDIDRVKTNDLYLEKYLDQNDLDMKLSLQMLWDVCIWRKTFGSNDITEDNVRRDYLEDGAMFPRNRDKDGKMLLIFRAKLHIRGSKDMGEMMRVVVYWLERLLEENNLDKITVFFDMQNTSISNVDMDLIRKVIEVLKLYPSLLNYIIIYELPWILQAAFKIIKALLPPKAVAIMKFLNEKNINDYIDNDNLLSVCGGNDDYVYSFHSAVPKTKTLSKADSKEPSSQSDKNNNDTLDVSSRKVHFANSGPTHVPMSDSEDQLKPLDEEMLRVTPPEVIVLNKTEGSKDGELSGTFEITSTSTSIITYKIKTTSPLKFRVRPSSGALSPGNSVTINIILQPGKQVSAGSKDKFLVMCTALPDGIDTNNTQFITEFWKALPLCSPNVQQYRLQCITAQLSQNEQLRNGHLHISNSFPEDISDRRIMNTAEFGDTLKRIEKQMRMSVNLHWLSLLIFTAVSIALLYIIKQEIQEQDSYSCSRDARFQ